MHPQASILITDPNQFLEDLEARFRRVLQSQPATPLPVAARNPKSVRQIAEKFDVCVATVWDWARTGKIASHKIAGRTYFFEEEIIAALEKNQRTLKTKKAQ